MNKKILASIFVIGILAFAMGWGTYSYFSDTEKSSGNTFTAGIIDISIDPSGGQQVATVKGDVELKPCETGYIRTVVKNVGNNPSEVWKHITNVVNNENGIAEPEQEYYSANSGSDLWKISDCILYDLYAVPFAQYQWDQSSFVYRSGTNGWMTILLTRTFTTTGVKWTVDLSNIPSPWYGTAVQLAIGDGTLPKFQVAVNTANPTPFYKDYPWTSPIQSLPAGITMIGNCGDTHFEITISYEFLDSKFATSTFYWAINTEYSKAGANQFTFPKDATDIWTSSAHYYKDNFGQVIISEGEGYTLTGTKGVASTWISLGELQPYEYMVVIQSYHLKADVGNWAQSDKVTFDIELFAQQVGAPAPTPELP
jgi:predicted ribosomally synthesized peptide with SipW-like signal peptide